MAGCQTTLSTSHQQIYNVDKINKLNTEYKYQCDHPDHAPCCQELIDKATKLNNVHNKDSDRLIKIYQRPHLTGSFTS